MDEPADGAFFHVPHGLSNAMLLPEITGVFAPAALNATPIFARAMGSPKNSEGARRGWRGAR